MSKWEPDDIIVGTIGIGFIVILPLMLIIWGIVHDVVHAACR